MNHWLSTATAVLAIFAIIGIGAAARRVRWLTEEADRSLLQLVIRVLLPALILSVILGKRHLMNASNLILPPMVGFVTVAGGFGVGLLVARLIGRALRLENASQRATFALCVGLYNYGYVPLPLAQQLFGDDTVAILFVHNLGAEIAAWTLGIVLLSGHLGGEWYRRVFNAPSITIAVTLLITALGLDRFFPALVQQAAAMLGAAAIPMGLLLVGATMADEFGKSKIASGGRVMVAASLLRLALLPAAFLAIALLIPASRELKNVIAIEAAMPSAVFPVLLARHYGGHPPTALRIALATSLISLITMPLWLSAGMWVLGLEAK